jgi:hypothetical protein
VEIRAAPAGRDDHPVFTVSTTDGLASLTGKERQRRSARRTLKSADAGSKGSANFRKTSMLYWLKHFGMPRGYRDVDRFVGN